MRKEVTLELIRAAMARGVAGQFDEAVALLELAAAGDPALNQSLASMLHQRGNDRLGRGDQAGAVADFDRAASLDPSDAWSVYNIGVVEESQGKRAKAESRYREAIGRDPILWPAWNNLLLLLKASGRMVEAVQAGRVAHAAHPTFYDVLVNLGDTETTAGMLTDGVRRLRRACALRQEPWEALNGCGLALGLAGDVENALTALRRSIALNPGARIAWNNLSVAAPAANEVIVALRRALAVDPGDAAVHSNLIFALTYVSDGGDRSPQVEAARWAARHAPPIPDPAFANGRDPDRRLRVGYISTDFRSHPIAYSIEAVFRGHDRDRVEIVAYSASPIRDAVSRTLAGAVDLWRDVAGWSDAEIADCMRADGIDVLVVIAGHAGANPLKIAGLSPAPVQISLYDVTTSGVEAMDAWITDPVLHPPGSAEPFVEALAYLPCLHIHVPPEDAPQPRARGDRPIVFGSLANPIKLSPELIEAWRRILDAVPGSTLLLKYKNRFASPLVQAPIRSALGERARFLWGDRGRNDHLELWNEIDVALDSYPFNGSTTTFEALWMGVPVVTLAGTRFVSRICAGFLERLDLADLVATDFDGYVERAVGLAGDGKRLDSLRDGLRSRLAGSIVCDARANAGALEAAYRRLWAAWCARP